MESIVIKLKYKPRTKIIIVNNYHGKFLAIKGFKAMTLNRYYRMYKEFDCAGLKKLGYQYLIFSRYFGFGNSRKEALQNLNNKLSFKDKILIKLLEFVESRNNLK